MDPNACYSEMTYCAEHGEWTQAREYAEALEEWLNNGGFFPVGIDRKQVWSAIYHILAMF